MVPGSMSIESLHLKANDALSMLLKLCVFLYRLNYLLISKMTLLINGLNETVMLFCLPMLDWNIVVISEREFKPLSSQTIIRDLSKSTTLCSDTVSFSQASTDLIVKIATNREIRYWDAGIFDF
ncbi:hypothetical protein BpHYR1_029294 [Brachionus plicatilis]|uniref:Uncharacterized protein n=1 Tax=Brachionus plicatilis TaxID=10195 RepID=A0A3M7P7S2_BRAPC|nr:hypothetical protein BpHYR1_029294 [Brachionus plicatilis]